jgi:molybdopterin/thiamine biosynthesis adenylyltransferase
LAQIGNTLAGRLLLLDARAMEWTSIKIARNDACLVCGHDANHGNSAHAHSK